MFLAQLAAVLTTYPAVGAYEDEGNGEHLTLIETDSTDHVEFPRLLHVFKEFDEEAEREDTRQHPAEEEARAHLGLIVPVEPEAYGEEQEVECCLEELARIAGKVLAETPYEL